MGVIDKAGACAALAGMLLGGIAYALSAAAKCEASNYVDNGDGTITDTKAALMWEKLSNDGTIHDYAHLYTFFEAKIATLNSSSFAGHNDWRLPNRVEMETLPALGRVSPTIDPAFDKSCTASCTVLMCSCTQSDYDWSSTTYHGAPPYAWGVYFNSGAVVTGNRSTSYYVRAVRGGL